MGGPILYLDADDVRALLPAVDPAEAVAEEMLGSASGAVGPDRERDTLALHGGRIVRRDPATGALCALPAAELRASRAAALTSLAASHLLAPGLVTVSLLGCGAVALIHLLVLARRVPDVSHIAVYRPAGRARAPLDRTVAEALERAGIGLAVTDRAEDATFGANLVALVGPAGPGALPGRLSPGAVLVNASGHNLSAGAAGETARVFVDDRALEHRLPAGTSVEADLKEVFTGLHRGRTRVEEVLRVELLSVAEPDSTLAARFHAAALRHGRGVLRSDGVFPPPAPRRPSCPTC